MEKLHRTHNEQFAALFALVECGHWSVSWETDGSRRKNGHRRLAHVEGRAIRINELKAAIFVSVGEFVLRVLVALGVFSLLTLALFGLSLGNAHELVVEAPVADESLFGVKILEEALSNDRVSVAGNTNLLEHGIDVGSKLLFTSLRHHEQHAATRFDIGQQVLQLLCSEGRSWTTEQQKVGLLHLLELELFLVNDTLTTDQLSAKWSLPCNGP